MIVVIGDAIEDQYIYGTTNRISPESPIPIFEELSRETRAGGSLNVAANLKALGEEVTHYSFDIKPIKTRYVVDNHILFRSDLEKYNKSDKTEFDLKGAKYCIISDYNKGFIHESQKIVDYCKSQGCFVIVDPKKHLSNYKNADIVKLNKKEFEEYAGGSLKIRKEYNIGALVITLGSMGVYISSDEYEELFPCNSHEVADVTGAGDVFIAAMTHYLSRGKSLTQSCEKANILAGISVTKFGTYTLQKEDIKQTKTIFTNGCFDILHKGHIDYLRKSKALGAKLIVGLNSDQSVKKLKGSSRPYNNQNDRKTVLESLEFVDEVIIFDEETPYELIKRIRPDVITKGGDYTSDRVVGNDLSEVVIIPYIEGYSTTNILEKL